MELAKLNKSLPVKAYPEQELNKVILMNFTPWIASLLSLTGDTSVDRLEIALPAIKEHCWSMGFDEIKKMFEMYADNKLNIEAIPNYFDRILFGKIVDAYKQQKPAKKTEIIEFKISEDEKKIRIGRGIINCYKEFKETDTIVAGYVWVYDHLNEIGVLKFTVDQKKFKMQIAKSKEKAELEPDKVGYRNKLAMIEEKNSAKIINRAKRMLLEDFFTSKSIDEVEEIIK